MNKGTGDVMKKYTLALMIFLCAVIFSSVSLSASGPSQEKPGSKSGAKASARLASIDRGRYLVKISGCNDCHTAGWMTTAGKVPEAKWLTGDTTGWSGPWGTTYPINLRFFFNDLTEDGWIRMARNLQARPPMPWYAVREMKEGDLRAIYRLVRSLGPEGEAAPSYLPPGQEPKPPYFMFVPPDGMPQK
jgi:hypothetical protein